MPLIGRDKVDAGITKLVNDTNDELTSIVTKGFTATMIATPTHFEDGGRMQAGWNLSIGSPDLSSNGSAKGSAYSIAGLSKMPSFILGKQVYLSNISGGILEVEYGGYPNPPENGTWTGEKFEKLSEGGYSRQAPEGMARINLIKMQQKIKKL